jgi:hypothetical protein
MAKKITNGTHSKIFWAADMLSIVLNVQECDATDVHRSMFARFNMLSNKRGKTLSEFQRLLVLLWPNNKQIRRKAKVKTKN